MLRPWNRLELIFFLPFGKHLLQPESFCRGAIGRNHLSCMILKLIRTKQNPFKIKLLVIPRRTFESAHSYANRNAKHAFYEACLRPALGRSITAPCHLSLMAFLHLIFCQQERFSSHALSHRDHRCAKLPTKRAANPNTTVALTYQRKTKNHYIKKPAPHPDPSTVSSLLLAGGAPGARSPQCVRSQAQ